MEGNKSFFHAITISLENLLREYKRQYPMNVGDLLAKAFPILLLIFMLVKKVKFDLPKQKDKIIAAVE